MKVVEFKMKTGNSGPVLCSGRPVLREDGMPAMCSDLVPGRVYSVQFDEHDAAKPAKLLKVENRTMNRAQRRRERSIKK